MGLSGGKVGREEDGGGGYYGHMDSSTAKGGCALLLWLGAEEEGRGRGQGPFPLCLLRKQRAIKNQDKTGGVRSVSVWLGLWDGCASRTATACGQDAVNRPWGR